MANTASRLSANGSLTINGSFDEINGGVSANGLVVYLDAGRIESYPGYGNKWIDLSGNNNDGTIVGNVRFVANGTSSYFNWPEQTDYNYVVGANTFDYQDCTIVFYADPTGTGFTTLFAAGQGDNLPYAYDLSLRTGSTGPSTAWYIPNSGNYNDWSSISVPTSNTIYYLNGTVAPAVNRDIANKAILFNPGAWNILGGTKKSIAFFNTWRYYLGSGGYPGRSWKGRIAALLLYNRPISESEQIKNYNYFAQRYGISSNTKPTVSQVAANSITQSIRYQTNGFDEVTYNPSSNNNVNLVQWSQDFTQSAGWFKAGSSLTGNAAIAPDGTMTANQLIVNNGGQSGWLDSGGYTPAFSANKPYTFSVYAKAGTGTPSQFYILVYGSYFSNRFDTNLGARFDLSTGTAYNEGNGTITSVGITYVGNGWYRCWMTATAAKDYVAGTSTQLIRTVYTTVGQYMYFWGYQIEQSTSPSIYVPTGANAIIANTFNQRTTNTGNTYIRGSYDEYSKMSPITDGLIFNIDPGYEGSYPGTGAAMYDTSPNRYKVDLLGNATPKYSSDYGGIIKFTGTLGNNEYANTNIPSRIITSTTNYTMSAWVKINPSIKSFAESNAYDITTGIISTNQTANTGYARGSAGSILGTNYFGGYGLYWYTYMYQGIKYIYLGFQNRVNTPTYAEASPAFTYTINDSCPYLNWTHVVGVLNVSGNFCGLYINGVLLNSTTASQIAVSPFDYPFPTIRLAWDGVAGGSAAPKNIDGDIGPMSIWNRALSISEIQQIYSSQRSRFGV